MKVLVLGHQRSGSSNLTRFIAGACLPRNTTLDKNIVNQYLAMEPFSPKAVLSRTRYSIKDIRLRIFNKYILKVAAEKDFIKHIYGNDHFMLDELVIKKFEATHKIVFIYRENVELAALSHLIAKISKNWGRVNKDKILSSKGLPLEEIRNVAKRYENSQRLLKNYLDKSPSDYFSVSYEDFYGNAFKSKTHERLISFLGEEVINDNNAAKSFLNNNNKINSSQTYCLIPNILEICEAFPNIKNEIAHELPLKQKKRFWLF